MCYHVSTLNHKKLKKVSLHDVLELSSGIHADDLKSARFHVNGFKFPMVDVFTNENHNLVEEYYWGLIPSWVKDKAQALKIRSGTLNARSDAMFEKPSYRNANASGQRLIIPVTGFFEWHEFHKHKYPFYVHMDDAAIFFLGGIWDQWMNPENGELIKSFSLVTTDANPMMAKIHNDGQRMPLIIPKEHIFKWLDSKLSKDEVLDFCHPFPELHMKAHSIGKLLSSRNEETDVAKVQEKVNYPALEYDKLLKDII